LLPSGTTGAFTDTSSPRVEIRRPSTAEESKVADNPAVVFTFSSDRQVSDLLHDSNKSVLMVVGAPAGSVSALTIQFSGDNAQGAKQNDEKNKPLDLRNDPNSVRFMVAAIERQKEAGAAEVNLRNARDLDLFSIKELFC
jgi:stress response protein SCP2